MPDLRSFIGRSPAAAAFGSLVVGLVTVASYRLQATDAAAALLYLFVIVLLSLRATLPASLFVSIVAVWCLDYFFTPPLFEIRLNEGMDVLALLAFSTSAVVITQLMRRANRSLESLRAEVEERRRAEDALRDQASLLDLTHDAIFVRGGNDAIVYWNRGAEELYGWKREEAMGHITHQLLQTVFPMPLADIDAVVARHGRWEGELEHTTRAGIQITVASRWSIQQDAHGRRLGTLETNNDITARRQAEEAMRKAQADLAHAARIMTMGEMAASIAHEVNQPLSGVVINANASLRWLAAQPADLVEAREAIQRIIRDGKRAGQVIARVRALSKKTVAEKERIDLNASIQEVVSLAQGELSRARVALTTELDPNLAPVLGDRVQLQQVILNLILNGIEAMTTVVDRPRVIRLGSYRETGGRVRVAVQDSGIGLDPDHANDIFQAFYSTKRGGMGMGLSISRSIIETHGGRLWAAPNDGPGTTFQFTL